ncbi:MAG TPA: hypothetical protein VGM90_33135 [Kofleriaceae bacterium]
MALRRLGGFWENLVAALFIVGAPTWWGDIYCRLGPAEGYMVPALALYAWGTIAAVRTMRSTRLARYHAWCGAALAIGGIVAAGSKENAVFLILPSVYLAARARWRGSHRWITVGAAVHIVFGIFVAIATYVGVKRFGHVYNDSTSASGRIQLMTTAARELVTDNWLAIAAGITTTIVLVVVAKNRRALVAQLVMPSASIAFVFVTWLSQVAFYNGWPPQLGRYYLPGALAAPIAIYSCYVAIVRAARFFDIRAALLIRCLALALMVWQLFHLDYILHAQSVAMRDSSIEFAKKLRRVIRAANANPTVPIVMVSNSVWAYEPVDSLQTFLRHAHVSNPVYMINRFTPSEFPEGSLERSLSEQMENAARDGGAGLFPLAQPFAYQTGGDCVGVGFNGDTGLTSCATIADF